MPWAAYYLRSNHPSRRNLERSVIQPPGATPWMEEHRTPMLATPKEHGPSSRRTGCGSATTLDGGDAPTSRTTRLSVHRSCRELGLGNSTPGDVTTQSHSLSPCHFPFGVSLLAFGGG